MVERVRITGNRILTRNASNQIVFDSNNLLMKVGGGSVYLDGYKKTPVAYGGPLGVGNANSGGFLIWSASLFGSQTQSVERWLPRFTNAWIESSHYLSYITPQRYLVTPYSQVQLSGHTIATSRWVGTCGIGLLGERMVRFVPEISWNVVSARAGYIIIPWSNYVNFTYTDNGALYLSEFGPVTSFQFGFDMFGDAAPRAASYSRTP